MNWKPTLRLRLTEQSEQPDQRPLFQSAAESETPCNHVGTAREIQISLDGSQDSICGACGAVTP